MEEIRCIFEKAGFPCSISDDIRFEVWNKLMINASSSALSGVLGVPQGYVAEDERKWILLPARWFALPGNRGFAYRCRKQS